MQQDKAVLGILVQMSATFLTSSGRIWAKHGLNLCNSAGWALICPSYSSHTPLMSSSPGHLSRTPDNLPQTETAGSSSPLPQEASPSALPQFSSHLAGGRRCAEDPARLARPLTSGKVVLKKCSVMLDAPSGSHIGSDFKCFEHSICRSCGHSALLDNQRLTCHFCKCFSSVFPALPPLLHRSCTVFAHNTAKTFISSGFCLKRGDAGY